MMIPKKIRRHSGDASGLDLEQFLLPKTLVIAGRVELAHDRQPGLSIPFQPAAIDGNAISGGIRAAHLKVPPQRLGKNGGESKVQGMRHRMLMAIVLKL